MNKKVYLCDLDFTRIRTPDFAIEGGVKANIVFNNIMSYDDFKKISDNTYFYLTDEDYKSRIDKAIEYIEARHIKAQVELTDREKHLLEILEGEDNV